jgi:hypothetical protein
MRGLTDPDDDARARPGRRRAIPALLGFVLIAMAMLTLSAACSGSSTTSGPDVSTGDQAAPARRSGPAGRRYD